jgi:hypothetical protein
MKFVPRSLFSPKGLIKLWGEVNMIVGRIQIMGNDSGGILGCSPDSPCGLNPGQDSIPDSHSTIYIYNLNKINI